LNLLTNVAGIGFETQANAGGEFTATVDISTAFSQSGDGSWQIV
jgi:hypothetical protein